MDKCKYNRSDTLKKAKCLIIKVGSAVLTDDNGLALPVLYNLVTQIARLRQRGYNVCLVSSGAVAAGRKALLGTKHSVDDLAERQGAAAIGQGRLMRAYEDAFSIHNLLCAQILLTRDDLRNRERFLNAKNTFRQLLDWGVIPIVNENDTVVIQELKFGDNDSLASLITNLVEADISINLTSTNGVLAQNPMTANHENLLILDTIDNIESLDLNTLCGGKTSVGTGGMYSKLMAARRTAQLGVPTLILPGKADNIILRAFDGENIGTWVSCAKQQVSRRKYWLAYQSDTQGSINIDKGAYEALHNKGKSLLSAGIMSIDGDFGVGSLVKINYDDKTIAVGLTNYSAADLCKIQGLKRHEVAEILGNAHYPEAIHRDNLLMNAAL